MKRIYSKRVPHWRWEYREGHEDAMVCALRDRGIKVRFLAGMAELVTPDGGSLMVLPGQFMVFTDDQQLREVLTYAEFHWKYEE